MASLSLLADPLWTSLDAPTAPLPDIPFVIFQIFAICFGACFGSFANAAAMRLVRDESPHSPASRCRSCDKNLSWHQNIPIVSWLILRGKTACCDTPLALRYIFVEVAFAGLALLYVSVMPLAVAAYFLLLCIIMMIALLTDLEAMVLHPPSLLLGIIAGLIAPFLIPAWPVPAFHAVIGAVTGSGILLLFNGAYRFMRGHNGFGAGDIWLMALIGAVLGWQAALFSFFAASLLGAIAGIGLILVQKAGAMTKLPFGLFLSFVFLLYPALNMLLF